jgi:hypothetical protein
LCGNMRIWVFFVVLWKEASFSVLVQSCFSSWWLCIICFHLVLPSLYIKMK